ncbi:IclR family transcriptional regulator [Brooklawnia sp.]|uniref:IclR family transcriptional regulator n=1 Tax=Brooklawnia sp. TaxID=2699740 RepID=UPI00311E6CA7
MAADTTRSVARATELLRAICEQPGITLSQAARDCDLAVSSAFRLLSTLESEGFVAREAGGCYVVGPQMIRLGAHVFADNSLRRICRPGMAELADQTGESIYLSVANQGSALYIAMVAGQQAVQLKSWEGQTVPLRGSAIGRVLTGRLPRDEPYAVVPSGVEKDVTAIAAPIWSGNSVIAALSMVVPSYRLNGSAGRYGELVAERAGELSALLGYERKQEQSRRRRRLPSRGRPPTRRTGAVGSNDNGGTQ